MHETYDPRAIESAAQQFWNQTRAFEVTEDPSKPKFYCLSMLPYPSGALHMGHVRNYTIGDVISRYQRMQGKNVLQPMGWDAFGLPAENAAIRNNTAPAKWTWANIAHMKMQLQRMGFAYDWSREFAACQPGYYVHEQRMFVRLFKQGLAYRRNSVVNWDPVDQTVLANEQVIDGRGWRTGAPVEKREIPQWFLKITAYAQELLDGLDRLPGWPDAVKTMQRNWIGRSEGLEIRFDVDGGDASLTVFTTRPDTLMGATYIAVAAEHPLALEAAENSSELADFIASCRHGGVSEAELETQEKRGMATGAYAIHPLTGERLPVWVANFVLMGYGTGAVMAVPGHDQRDFEFAHRYGLPIRQVIALREPPDPAQSEGEDLHRYDADVWKDWYADKTRTDMRVVNSGAMDGMRYREAFDHIAGVLEAAGKGRRKINWRLRDWGVSRQRYWGCPIPIVYCTACGAMPVPEDQLPVLLPEDVSFSGVRSPLKTDPEWRRTTCPQCGGPAERETDTFDTFMESSWYYARYTSPGASDMVDARADYWLPVDQYIGGIEHAILHLLYFRFYHKLMRDQGLVASDEPATNLLCQGMVIAETFYRDEPVSSPESRPDGGLATSLARTRVWINPADVEMERDARAHVIGARLKADGQPVSIGGVEKMSKSKNNGVDPQTMVDRYGADTVRLFSMFAAPPEQSLEWNEAGVEGCHRFLKRVWNHAVTLATELQARGRPDPVDAARLRASHRSLMVARREIHDCLHQANVDYQRKQYNTVVSACMKIMNVLAGEAFHEHAAADAVDAAGARFGVQFEGFRILLRLLNPMTPHLGHVLWAQFGDGEDIAEAGWPEASEEARRRDAITLAVQVNGKLRGAIEIRANASREAIEREALAETGVARFIDGRVIRKIIVVPGKIVNIVV
ncbi:MAG TPA: leucine--tRNA ligase [Rhodanobacteraceae bacterium]|nr:leucine--tRNA ligase [Rhodanobacteraceae bacterium]